MSKIESESARKIARREVLYKATSKKLTEYITGGTGLERERGEPLKQYKEREFEFACEVLNTEIDSLESIQAAFLRGKYGPTIVLDREYALVMVMRAFADYLRFKPTDCATARLGNCRIQKLRTRRPGRRRATTKAP